MIRLPQRLESRFELIRTFRADADSGVFEVLDRERRILRTLRVARITDDRETRACAEEFELLRGLRHPNLTEILEFGASDEECFLVREHVEGETLAIAGPALEKHDRVRIFAQIVAALAKLHARGVVHGDLKPDNVLIRRAGASPDAVVTDFGLAARLDAFVGGSSGTPPFIAPERLLGLPVDARSDLFSLAVTWIACTPGAPPIDERSLYERFPKVEFFTAASIDVAVLDPELAPILRAMAASAPAERPRSALEVLDRLGVSSNLEAREYARVLRPPPAFFGADGRPIGDEIAGAESFLEGGGEQRTLLVSVASGSDAKEIEGWLRFHAARLRRPIVEPAELRARFAGDAAEAESPGSRVGRDAAIARDIVGRSFGATLLLPPSLTAMRNGAVAAALARAVKSAPSDAARFLAIALPENQGARGNTALEEIVELTLRLPAISDSSLAAHLKRCEDPDSDDAGDRLRKTAQRLLALAGPDAETIESYLTLGLENGEIDLRGARFDFSRFDPKGALPGVDRELARLGESERRLLAAVAMLGGRATRDELADVGHDQLESSIAALRRLGRMVAEGVVLRAEPPNLAVASCDALDPAERNRIAAALIPRMRLERPDSVRALLFAYSGRGEDAITTLRGGVHSDPSAADHVARVVESLPRRSAQRFAAARILARIHCDDGRLDDAIETLQHTLDGGCDEVIAELELRMRLGALHNVVGGNDESLAQFEHVKARLRDLRAAAPESMRREVERGLALSRAARGDVSGAIAKLQLVLRGVGDEPDAAERSLSVLLGGLALREGKFAAARRTLESTIAAARKCDDEPIVAAAATNLATLEQREGALDRAVALLEEALAIRARQGDLYEEAIVRNNLGLALRERGELDRSARELHEARALRIRMGDDLGASTVALNLAGVLALTGDFEAASRLAVQATQTLRTLGKGRDAPEIDIAIARLIEIARICGPDSDAARERTLLVGTGGERVGPITAAARRARGERRLSESLELDDSAAALRLAREAASSFEQAGDRIGVARAAIEVSRRQIEMADLDGADIELARAQRLAPVRLEADLHRVSALLASARGATEEEERELAHAIQAAARCGLAVVHGEVLLRDLARLAGKGDARESARRIELRSLASRFRVPGHGRAEPVERLRRIYGKLVAPDFRVETTDHETTSNIDGRVLTAGIPEEVFRTFVMINRSVLRETDLDRMLERLLEHAVALSGARRGFVVLLRDGRVVCEARSGELEPENEELSRGIVLEAIQQMRPLVTANAKSDARLSGRKSIERFDLRSVLCVPFKCFSGTEGAIYVDNPVREGVFGGRAVDFLEALASQAAIAIGNLERNREIERLNEELKKRVAVQEVELDLARRELVKTGVADGARRMIAQSESMRQVVDLARRVAKSDLPVLVLGESGTGKEMLARFVHEASSRCAMAFVAENCSAIPETLLESEFFGCVKGAFTGADQDRDGLFRKADGGTLFLDEIGDMPLSLQAKLLRAIQEKAIRKVGASSLTPVDVRLVCATHRDVEAMVAEGTFREDLYYRIRGVVLRIPPLRERMDDLPTLVEGVLERLNARHQSRKRASKALLKKLLQHDWPGNVRELESEVTRLYHLAAEDEIDDSALELKTRSTPGDGDSSVVAVRPIDEIERDAIRLALRETGGNREEAARRLRISRAAFYVKLKAYGLQDSSPSSRRKKS